MPLPLSLIVSTWTCTGHRLLDYNGKCAHLHGHNYKWEIELGWPDLGQFDEPYGIAIDFNVVKKEIAGVVEEFDHAMVLREDDPLVQFLRDTKQRRVILNVNPTAENMAFLVAGVLHETFKEFFENITVWVTLHETPKCSVRASAIGTTMQTAIEVSDGTT